MSGGKVSGVKCRTSLFLHTKSLLGERDAGRSGFYDASNGVTEFTAFGGIVCTGSLVLMAACSVRSNCVLYLVVVSIVVLSQPISCPVVREWWAGAD